MTMTKKPQTSYNTTTRNGEKQESTFRFTRLRIRLEQTETIILTFCNCIQLY